MRIRTLNLQLNDHTSCMGAYAIVCICSIAVSYRFFTCFNSRYSTTTEQYCIVHCNNMPSQLKTTCIQSCTALSRTRGLRVTVYRACMMVTLIYACMFNSCPMFSVYGVRLISAMLIITICHLHESCDHSVVMVHRQNHVMKKLLLR